MTPNNPGGSAPGPNMLLNKPVLTSVVSTSSGVDVNGTYTGAPIQRISSNFSPAPWAAPSGYGQGQQFLGTISVTTDSTGSGTFTDQIPTFVPAGQLVTATATDASNNTSEFSAWIKELVGSRAVLDDVLFRFRGER